MCMNKVNIEQEEFEKMLRVGVITQTHGLKGEVKVFPTSDEQNRFESLERVYLIFEKKGLKKNIREIYELEIEKVRYFKQFVILKFKDIDNINDIEPYKGMDLMIKRENALPLADGEYFIADIIGLKVYDEEGEIGVVKDVLQTGANDVYIVKCNDRYDNKELMLPNISDCIKEVDVPGKKMKVHIMKGLLDL